MGDRQQPTMPTEPGWVRFCRWLWKWRNFVWGMVVVGLIVGLIAGWLLTPRGTHFSQTQLGFFLYHHPLPFILIGVGLLGLTGVLWLINRRYPAPPPQNGSPDPLTQLARQTLVQDLRQRYSERLAKSLPLSGAPMMELRLHERPDMIQRTDQTEFRHTDAVREAPLAPGTTILEAYEKAMRRLLILGAPGAGKTILLLDLAQKLLTRAESNPEHPIPIAVVLSLSSWSEKTSLECWLIKQLPFQGIPSSMGQTLLREDQLILLLEDLDAVDDSLRSDCIDAINQYVKNHFAGLVVCSRSRVYVTQKARLEPPFKALEIQPLQEQEVMQYLKGIGKPTAAIRAVLQRNPVLKELLTMPLMLSIAIRAYQGKRVKDIPRSGSAQDQQRQIFDAYLERQLGEQARDRDYTLQQRRWLIFRKSGTIKARIAHYTSQQTRRWLIWLAEQMKPRHEFYLEGLQPDWLPAGRPSRLYHVLVGRLTLGLVGGSIIGLLTGLLGKGPTNTFLDAFVGGLSFGLPSAMLIGAVVGADTKVQPPQAIRWSWIRFWQKRPNMIRILWAGARGGGLYLGVPIALILFVIGLFERVYFWELIWSVLAVLLVVSGCFAFLMLIIVSFLWFISGWSRAAIDLLHLVRPNQGIWYSVRNTLFFGSFGGLISGILTKLLFFGSPDGTLIALLVGVLVGLSLGIWCGGATCLRHFAIRFLLWRSGDIPWFYVCFLEEAAKYILLQHVGSGYRFIHPLLQDYFASLGAEAPTSSQSYPSLPQSQYSPASR
jgi:hypothetical protein